MVAKFVLFGQRNKKDNHNINILRDATNQPVIPHVLAILLASTGSISNFKN
jgi:hypothetical protein